MTPASDRHGRRNGVIDRIERRPALWGTALLAVVAAVTVLATVAVDGLPVGGERTTLRVELPGGAPLLRPGGEVRIAGRRVGSVTGVDVVRDGARATVRVEEPVGAGATARVRLRGMAGAVYLELAPGDVDRPLADGDLVAREDVRAAPDLTSVVAGFDRDARAALARTATTAGQGLAGRGRALNASLAAAPDALDGVAPLIRAVRPRPGALAGLLAGADAVARALAPQPAAPAAGSAADAGPGREPATSSDLGTLAAGADAAAAPVADRAAELEATLRALPGAEFQALRALPELDPVLGDAEPALRELRPAADRLAAVIEPVRGLQADAARGRFRDAAALARDALPVLRDAPPVLGAARWPARAARPLATDTGTLARALVPYREELVAAPAGFTRWGSFRYADGQAKGARAVRFTMVLSCIAGRTPYPAPGEAAADRKACR